MRRDERTVVGNLACLLVAVLIAAGLLRLGVKLKEVQVDGAAGYSYANVRQSVRRVQTAGVRGRVLDRRGSVLATNRRSISIVCDPAAFQERTWEDTAASMERAIERLGSVLGRPSPLTGRAVRRHVSQRLAIPLVAWNEVGVDELAVFSEREREFPGFLAVENVARVYPAGRSAAHVIGYVGRDRGEAEAGDEKFNFFLPEMRGRAGLEAFYDSYLRGVPGERKVQVDARGFATRAWTVVEPKRGPDLRLALDLSVQREVERQLRGEIGACVVINPVTGDVLALASAPGFDPNEFVPVLTPDVYGRYASDSLKPLLNRASGGL